LAALGGGESDGAWSRPEPALELEPALEMELELEVVEPEQPTRPRIGTTRKTPATRCRESTLV
jgi:hypothetical protein